MEKIIIKTKPVNLQKYIVKLRTKPSVWRMKVHNIILFSIYLFWKITVEYIKALVKEKWGGGGTVERQKKGKKKLGF